MPPPSIRRAVPALAVSLVIGAVAGSAFAGAPDPRGARRSDPRAPAVLPASYLRGESVDRLVAKRLARQGSVDVLVTLDGAATLSAARSSSGSDSRELLRTTVPAYRTLKAGLRTRVPGLRVLRDYRALPVVLVRIRSRAQLRRLAAVPSVVGIGADRRDEAMLTQSLPLIGQPVVAAGGATGAGTAVAVLDTGVDFTRPAFGSCATVGAPGCRVVVAQDFAPDDGLRDDPAAGFHGTNVSGIVAGVAPDTKLLGLDVFSGLGSNTSAQIAAINFVIANQATFNIRALNMSLGSAESFHTSSCSDPADARVAAFANARAAGILPIIAAGNDRFANGSNHVGISRPACIPGVIPVGAVYDGNNGGITWGGPNANDRCTDATSAADRITCFSQVWTNPMVLAPGALIVAAGVQQGGTSQAAPHVAGAVAVLHDAVDVSVGSAMATPAQVETTLLNSGPSISDPLVGQGFPRLDLPAAISALGGLPPPTTTTPPPGACTIEGTGNAEVLVGTSADDVICGQGGNDLLVPNGGTDTIIGGDGFDFVSLEEATGPGTIDLVAGLATAPGASATLQGIEGGVGTAFADTLTGNAQDNDFLGLGGDDTLVGGGGFDFVRYDIATNRIRADLGLGVGRGEGTDSFDSFEGFVGGPRDDEAVGSGKANVLAGLRGDDRLSGLGKPDRLFGGPGPDDLFGGGGDDDLIGGAGTDTCKVGPGGGSTSSC